MRAFASDNYAGAHPEVLAAIAEANRDHVVSYGDDPWTARATELLKVQFGATAQPWLVFNGTAANVLAIGALTRSWECVITPQSSHLHVDGSRLANAAVAAGASLAEVSVEAGADVASIGFTKNGALGVEAVVFFAESGPASPQGFAWMRKQHAQLSSKMRFMAAQVVALLQDGLWARSAAHANAMAALLAGEVA